MQGPYALGIDLGTSNCSVALAHSGGVITLPLDQLEEPNVVVAKETLPSLLFLPPDGEVDFNRLPALEATSPWVTGAYVKGRAAEVPDRVVASAKSWLCAGHVDRGQGILPWQSEIQQKLSPVDAAGKLLGYLLRGVSQWLTANNVGCSLADLPITITVPASFDEVARQLTIRAADQAGIQNLTLLEEPIAAFYAYLQCNPDWREQIAPGDLVLVCDVGGGTSDFSLIAASDQGGTLALERISVGRHLLLGGDNMDLALAVQVKNQLESDGHALDRWQLLSLIASCRQAKESLLGVDSPSAVNLSIASRGSSLFASAISFALTKDQVHETIVEGFFPLTNIAARPVRAQLGLQELGLHYEQDAVLSKHLAEFLAASFEQVRATQTLREKLPAAVMEHAAEVGALLPTHVLFNGGVFHASQLQSRVTDQLKDWRQGEAPRQLPYVNLDGAVAVGAAHYRHLTEAGTGVRVGAGTSVTYYVGLESAGLAVPGMMPEIKGLCIVPKGTEESTTLRLESRQFGLTVGQVMQFRLFASDIRGDDTVGNLIPDAAHNLQELATLTTTLHPTERHSEGSLVAVSLEAEVTAVGTLRVAMAAKEDGQRWQLEFDVRGPGA